jgi:hypothetical protein
MESSTGGFRAASSSLAAIRSAAVLSSPSFGFNLLLPYDNFNDWQWNRRMDLFNVS